MAIKPILFNTEMVKAIVDGRKTQTRRAIRHVRAYGNATGRPFKEAPANKGDVLWVRETWGLYHQEPFFFVYKADSEPGDEFDCDPEWKWRPNIHMPKEAARLFLLVTDIRMERLQQLTDTDAEREGIGNLFLEDVGFGDKDYGCISYSDSKGYIGFQKEQFAHLWDSTIKKADLDTYGWEANPWVWVIEFERTEQETPF